MIAHRLKFRCVRRTPDCSNETVFIYQSKVEFKQQREHQYCYKVQEHGRLGHEQRLRVWISTALHKNAERITLMSPMSDVSRRVHLLNSTKSNRLRLLERVLSFKSSGIHILRGKQRLENGSRWSAHNLVVKTLTIAPSLVSRIHEIPQVGWLETLNYLIKRPSWQRSLGQNLYAFPWCWNDFPFAITQWCTKTGAHEWKVTGY